MLVVIVVHKDGSAFDLNDLELDFLRNCSNIESSSYLKIRWIQMNRLV